MFNLEKFDKQACYIHTPTKEKYDLVMKFLEDNGYKWASGDKPTEVNEWRNYGAQTCIGAAGNRVIGVDSIFTFKRYKFSELIEEE